MLGPFVDWMVDVRGLSPSSVRTLEISAAQADRFVRERCGRRLHRARTEDLQAFLASFTSARTRNSHLSRLRTFFAFVVESGIRHDSPADPIRAVREPRYLPRPIPRRQAAALLRAAVGDPPYLVAIAAMLYAGLRIGEVASLSWADIDLDARELRVVGKGSRERVLPISPALRRVLVAYRVACPTGSGLLFPSPTRTGRPLTTATLRIGIAAVARRAGIDRLTPHRLRHTFATQLIRAGANVRRVQALLGHASLASTQVYTQVTVEDLAGEVARLTYDDEPSDAKNGPGDEPLGRVGDA